MILFALRTRFDSAIIRQAIRARTRYNKETRPQQGQQLRIGLKNRNLGRRGKATWHPWGKNLCWSSYKSEGGKEKKRKAKGQPA